MKKPDISGHFEIDAKVQGRFRLAVGKEGTSGYLREVEFPNLILDQGLDRLFTATSGGSVFARFAVGASSSPEDPSQTGPLAQIAIASSGTIGTPEWHGGSPYHISRSATKRFAAGQATGIIAEVCSGWSSGWFSRARVRDVNGEPTTLEVKDDEYLDITYTVDTYIDVADKPFTLNLSTGPVDGILRPAGLASTAVISSNFLHEGLRLGTIDRSTSGIRRSEVSATGVLGDPTDFPSGGSVVTAPDLSATPDPYVPGSFELSTVVEMPLHSGNTPEEGFRTWKFYFPYWIAYQLSFSPNVPKTPERIFRLRMKITLGRV